MTRLIVLSALVAAVAIAACGGGDSKANITPAPSTAATRAAAASVTAALPAKTPASSSSTTEAPGATVSSVPSGATATSAPTSGKTEVTGIVGSVNAGTHTIDIKQLQGAAVTKIEVDSSTSIRKASGGTLQFTDIKTSDRIIASGVLNDRNDALLASIITVQGVLPGAQPGG